METDKIFVSNSGAGMEKALKETERFAQYEKLSHKAGIHVRLLAEEMLGMIRAVAEPSQSVFWIDGNAREVRLHLTSRAEMDIDKRDELMSVSTSGKNISAVGIMGKIREMVEIGLQHYDDIGKTEAESGIPMLDYGAMGGEDPMMLQSMYTWSLQKYRDSVEEAKEDSEIAAEAWDELEKSIIANIADDVQVGIMKDTVELIVYKSFM
jgi:hypothetical protein